MTSKYERKLRKEFEAVDAKRKKTNIQIDNILQTELFEAERSRLRSGSGKSAFGKVTRNQKRIDRWTAIFDAILGRHNYYNVIDAYEASLKDMVLRAKLQPQNSKILRFFSKHGLDAGLTAEIDNKSGKREDGTSITTRDRLYARISGVQSALSLEKSFVESLQNTGQSEYEKFLSQEEAKTKPVYDQWREHLKRPAYSENISEAIRTFAESSFKGPEESGNTKINKGIDDATNIFTKLVNFAQSLISSIISGGALTVALPVEAMFTWPAFDILDYLDPGHILFATTGCVVFTIALAGSGYLWGVCLRNGFENKVIMESDRSTKLLTSKSQIWIRLSAVLFGVGLALIISGADLRSKIPEMNDWRTQYHRVEDAKTQNLDDQLQSPENNTLIVQQQQLSDKEASLALSRQQILEFGSQKFHSDEFLALGIYAFVFLLGGLKTLTSADRYFEYHLLASAMNSINESRMRLSAFRDLNKAFYDARAKDLEKTLNDLRIELWLVAPDDPLALAPKDEDGTSEDAKSVNTEKTKPHEEPSRDEKPPNEDEVSETYGDIWVRERLRNYVRAYTSVRGKRLHSLWLSSVTKAMS